MRVVLGPLTLVRMNKKGAGKFKIEVEWNSEVMCSEKKERRNVKSVFFVVVFRCF